MSKQWGRTNAGEVWVIWLALMGSSFFIVPSDEIWYVILKDWYMFIKLMFWYTSTFDNDGYHTLDSHSLCSPEQCLKHPLVCSFCDYYRLHRKYTSNEPCPINSLNYNWHSKGHSYAQSVSIFSPVISSTCQRLLDKSTCLKFYPWWYTQCRKSNLCQIECCPLTQRVWYSINLSPPGYS